MLPCESAKPIFTTMKKNDKKNSDDKKNGSSKLTLAFFFLGFIWLLMQSKKSIDDSTPLAVVKATHDSVKKEPLNANRTLKIAVISDMHSIYRMSDYIKVPKADLLIVAGDSVVEDEFEVLYLGMWLNNQVVNHSVVVFGNRDIQGEATYSLKELEKTLNGSTLIHEEVVEVLGYKIFGSPFTPEYSGVFQLYGEAEARAYWDRVLPNDTDVDIIVTHGPPFGFGDLVPKRGHKGDKELLRAVQNLKKKPLLWICGHIHEAHGVYSVPHPQGDIMLVNAAVHDLRNGVKEARPRVIDLPSLTVSQPTEEEVLKELGNQYRPWKDPFGDIYG